MILDRDYELKIDKAKVPDRLAGLRNEFTLVINDSVPLILEYLTVKRAVN